MDTDNFLDELIEKNWTTNEKLLASLVHFGSFNETIKKAAENVRGNSSLEFVAALAGGNVEIPEAVCEHVRGIMYKELKEK